MGDVLQNLGISLGAFLWQLVAFLVLLVVLRRFAYGPVTRILDERASKIRNSIETAERVQREMAEMEQRSRELLEQSRRESQTIIQQAQQTSDRIQAQAQDNARAQVNEAREQALREFERARNDAVDDLRRQVASVAIDVASRVVRRELDPKAHRQLIDEAISQSGEQLGGGHPVA